MAARTVLRPPLPRPEGFSEVLTPGALEASREGSIRLVTFATNHGLQILFAPREQRDADEYSAMLGHFTERVTSRGRSRSFSGHGHSSVSRNESEQRRSLLLPQEFKELGSERLVVICENCNTPG